MRVFSFVSAFLLVTIGFADAAAAAPTTTAEQSCAAPWIDPTVSQCVACQELLVAAQAASAAASGAYYANPNQSNQEAFTKAREAVSAAKNAAQVACQS